MRAKEEILYDIARTRRQAPKRWRHVHLAGGRDSDVARAWRATRGSRVVPALLAILAGAVGCWLNVRRQSAQGARW
jgi:hypothetical protein